MSSYTYRCCICEDTESTYNNHSVPYHWSLLWGDGGYLALCEKCSNKLSKEIAKALDKMSGIAVFNKE